MDEGWGSFLIIMIIYLCCRWMEIKDKRDGVRRWD